MKWGKMEGNNSRADVPDWVFLHISLVTRRSLSNPFFIREVEQTKSLIYG